MEISLENWFDNYETIISENKDKSITLFHGSYDEIKEVKHIRDVVHGLYFTPSFVEANDYVVAQSNGEGDFGHIYKVVVPLKNILVVEDIDKGTFYDQPIYSPEERYFRIDKTEDYPLQRVDDDWILKNWDNAKVTLTDIMEYGGQIQRLQKSIECSHKPTQKGGKCTKRTLNTIGKCHHHI